MSLDVRTIIVVLAILAVMLSGFILFAGQHTRSESSVKQWSIANLCIGMGLGFAYFYIQPTLNIEYVIVLGSALVATGLALQFTGIQSFKSRRVNKWLAIVFVCVVTLQAFWFEYVTPNVGLRSVVNSLLLALGCAACASVLFTHNKPRLKAVCWFTGLSFALLSAVLFVRAVLIGQSFISDYGLYLPVPINQAVFLACCILQLSISFGFLLMLNHQLVAEIETVASKDILTGASNRRQFEDEFERLLSKSKRRDETLSVMLIDVDNFKSINDNYGHPSGDEVLRRLTNIAISSIRTEDYFARYGGDEFCVLLPSVSTDDVLKVANRLLEAFAAATFVFGGEVIKGSISIGVSESSMVGLDATRLIEAADQALYKAKQDGRNRVVLHFLSN
jgi:diguanylate cyclase